jgi:penicillin-binding protein 1A
LVEDRNGRIVLDVERELRQEQRRMGDRYQLISPQNAYIMTKMLEKTVEEGTLVAGSGWGSKFTFQDENGRSFRIPMAGKTGTPQNWSDAWTVGYSPYYTTAVWFGFDRPGNSLGVEITGSTLAGHVWGDYMREIHKGLPRKDFVRPPSGIIDVTVCAKSGMLRTAFCNEREVTLPFLEGTHPVQYCELHRSVSPYEAKIPISIPFSGLDVDDLFKNLTMPVLPPDILSELPGDRTNRNPSSVRTNPTPFVDRGNNPFLDDDIFSGIQSWDWPGTDSFIEIPDSFYEAIIPDEISIVEDSQQGQFSNNYLDDSFNELPSWNPLD